LKTRTPDTFNQSLKTGKPPEASPKPAFPVILKELKDLSFLKGEILRGAQNDLREYRVFQQLVEQTFSS
jgi:hypothetical protein